MPLYKRKPFPLAEPPDDIKPSDKVFQIRFTKEIFKTYDEYLDRINFYRQRIWVCKVTGKTNLTYEEALVSECRALEKVQQFPKELIKPVLEMVQFSTISLKELVSKVSQTIKDVYLAGEELTGKKAESIKPCKILQVMKQDDVEGASPKYEVGWLDKNKKITEVSVENPEILVRKKPIVTQEMLKSFIRDSTLCAAPWVVHDSLAEKYGICTEIPEELKEKVAKLEQRIDHTVNDGKQKGTVQMENGGALSKKRKAREKDQPKGKPKEKRRKETGDENSEGKKSKRKGGDKDPNTLDEKSKGQKMKDMEEGDEKPKVEPVKYPIEDTLVQPEPHDPTSAPKPPPSTDFLVSMDCVGNLIMIWDFCTSFGKALHLWSFSLEDFEKAICYSEGESLLLAETHLALLRVVLENSAVYHELMQKKRKPKFSVQNWKDHLCDFLESEKLDKLSCHLEAIRSGGHRFLDATAKLEILSELVDRALDSDVIRHQLQEYIDERQALAASKREVQLEESRRKKEEVQLKQSNTTPDDNMVKENGIKQNGVVNIKEEDGVKSNGCKQVDVDDVVNNGDITNAMNFENSTEFLNDDANVNEASIKMKPEDSHGNGNGKVSEITTLGKAVDTDRESAGTEELKKLQEKKKTKAQQIKEQKQIQHRKLEVQKMKQRFEREIEKRFIRNNSLGRDREYNRYWFFRRDGRLFVENKESDRWGHYSAKEELEALITYLNPKGVREMALKKQLEKHQATISAAMQRRTKEIAQKFALEEASLRRSSRVRTQSKMIPSGFLAYVNKFKG